MANLQLRWINLSQLQEKALLFPTKDFCGYRPPSPEAHLYCAEEANKFNRTNSKSQKYYRCQKCFDINPHYHNSKPKWINVSVYMELLRLEVFTCSYSPRGGKGLFCSAPIHDGGNFCDIHAYKRDDVGKNILQESTEEKYIKGGLKCNSNIWLDELLDKDWYITNEIDITNSALIHFSEKTNTISIYGLFRGKFDNEDVINTSILMSLNTSYTVKESISSLFTIKKCKMEDIFPKR